MSEQPRIFFPVALNHSQWRCVIVGGGAEAEFKTRIFNQFCAIPDLVAEGFTPGLEELARKGLARLSRGSYRPEALDGARVVLACDEDEDLNLRVAEDAKSRGALFNMVDNAEASDFIATSFVRKGNITVTVMTDGLSPAFANSLRDKFSLILDGGYQEHLEFFVKLKERIGALTDDLRVKKSIWRDINTNGLLEKLECDDLPGAMAAVDAAVAKHVRAGTGRRVRKLPRSGRGRALRRSDEEGGV